MIQFLLEGGVAMVFVLLFGLIALGSASYGAAKRVRRVEGFVRNMSIATLFSILGGVSSGFAATFHHADRFSELAPNLPFNVVLLLGLGESLASAIVGFTLLSLVYFVWAIADRRMSSVSA